jgi:chorismate synthase
MSSANQFGKLFRVTTFGESHGVGLGCVIDGCPAGVAITTDEIQLALDRRKPGQSAWTSARKESDKVEILSGILDGKTLGTPIAAIVRNQDARSEDYQAVETALQAGELKRPGHADDQWRLKFGHSDTRGGGRASGRETVARVIAGAIAKKVARALAPEISVIGFASEVAGIAIDGDERAALLRSALEFPADAYAARIPSVEKSREVEELLVSAVQDGKSYGGIAEVVVLNAPSGLGQPVFHKLKSELASAYFGVGATSGVEIGDGFSASGTEGTEFHGAETARADATNSRYGGIRGGLSTGEPIVARIAFKPTSTVMDLAKRGRHDPCIVPRALPVLEAMTWLVLCDHLLWQRLDKI